MIDEEQVRRTARLASLELSDVEIEQMRLDLGGILDHVDQISELDLDGVEPTSQVVDLTNVLRPDAPRPSWPREEMLSRAPEPSQGAFRVPSPQAEA